MRRRVGVAAVQKSRQTEELFRQKKDELAALEIHQLDQQLDSFKQKLEEFASKHKNEIKKDPEFRKKFQVGSHESFFFKESFPAFSRAELPG